jgi:hypothetical protein
MEAIDALLSLQKKMGQLNKIFNNETVDLVHVSERFKPLSVILKTYG